VKGVKALINPATLRWARETAGFDLPDAADKLDQKPSKLEAWEQGDDTPSFKQLIRIGNLYKRPIGAFYLSEVPNEPTLRYERDYRRLPGQAKAHQSPELIYELRRCEYRRRVALDLYNEMELEIPDVPYIVRLNTEVEENARHTREFLGVTIDKQVHAWKDSYQAFNGWRDALENVGVMVFQGAKIKLNEMRAISIRDRPLPFILLNTKDVVNARVFSLIHEFVHILLVDNVRTNAELIAEDQEIERFCNAVAASVLMPRDGLSFYLAGIEDYQDDAVIAKMARRFSVSREAFVRRLATLSLVDQHFYRQKREEYRSEEEERAEKEKNKGGPEQHIKIVNASGYRFAELVLDGLDSGNVNAKEASDYFGASTKHFQNLRSLVQKRRRLRAET
jgi:Zn-dependent peptidase ImmA (M78 family)